MPLEIFQIPESNKGWGEVTKTEVWIEPTPLEGWQPTPEPQAPPPPPVDSPNQE